MRCGAPGIPSTGPLDTGPSRSSSTTRGCAGSFRISRAEAMFATGAGLGRPARTARRSHVPSPVAPCPARRRAAAPPSRRSRPAGPARADNRPATQAIWRAADRPRPASTGRGSHSPCGATGIAGRPARPTAIPARPSPHPRPGAAPSASAIHRVVGLLGATLAVGGHAWRLPQLPVSQNIRDRLRDRSSSAARSPGPRRSSAGAVRRRGPGRPATSPSRRPSAEPAGRGSRPGADATRHLRVPGQPRRRAGVRQQRVDLPHRAHSSSADAQIRPSWRRSSCTASSSASSWSRRPVQPQPRGSRPVPAGSRVAHVDAVGVNQRTRRAQCEFRVMTEKHLTMTPLDVMSRAIRILLITWGGVACRPSFVVRTSSASV